MVSQKVNYQGIFTTFKVFKTHRFGASSMFVQVTSRKNVVREPIWFEMRKRGL